jgi:alcohol dehydrogenase class IV
VATEIAERLGVAVVGAFDGAQMHTPVRVTEEALAYLSSLNANGIISIGGGTTTGLSKAIALRTDLPQLVLPTTYAGSEMTPILGETENGVKTTQRSTKVLPETVIYDVELTLDMPAQLAGVSGMNAIAHSVEALYARDGNPVITAIALESVRSLARALPVIRTDPASHDARTQALYGAWLAGICLGSVGMALHHKLCHTLGGTFDLAHAQTHAIVLPHALAYNAPAIPQSMARLAAVLDTIDPVQALYDLNCAIGAPLALADLGMPEDGIEHAVNLAVTNPYWNPREISRDALRTLIRRAFSGLPPCTV